MLWYSLLFYGPLTLFSLVILLWRHGLGFFVPADGWFGWSLIATGVGLLVVLLGRALSECEWSRDMESEFIKILGPIEGEEAVVLAVLSGLGEELFFRGVLLPWLGFWTSSVVFGTVHFPMNRKLVPWTIFALVMGLVLGWLLLASGSLVPPVVTHAVVNGVNLFLIGRRARRRGVPRPTFTLD